MDQAAIQQIQKTANMVKMNEELQKTKTKNPVFLAPTEFKIFNLEQHMEFRTSYRFNFDTTNIDDFIKYAEEYITLGSKCFVNADRMTAKSIFDLGTEGLAKHQNHTGDLTLKKLSDFQALLNVDQMKLSQKEAGNFLEDYADNIQAYTKDGAEMANSLAAQSLYDMTIEQARTVKSQVSNFGESLSAMEKIEAKNQDKLIAGFNFLCEPYMGLKARTFKVRLSILTGSDVPKISLKIIGLEKHQEEMSEEFRDQLVNAFTDTEMKVFIGS